MFVSLAKELGAAINVLKECIVASEGACSFGHEAEPSPGSGDFRKIIGSVPARRDWLVFNHCASVTRIYAIWERFVEDTLDAWLRVLPKLYQRYTSLPAVLIYEHKAGVARLLPKVGEGRFRHLTPEKLLRGIYRGVSAEAAYELPVEVYMIHDRNLRTNTLCDLFRKVNVENCSEWIKSNREMTAFMDQIYGSQQTAEGQLDALVAYRNEAAHGYEVAEVLSDRELLKLAAFISVLGAVLADLMEFRYWTLRVAGNSAAVVGSITEHLKRPNAFIAKVSNSRIWLGQGLVALERDRCRRVTVTSLQDNDIPMDSYDAVGEVELGVKFSEQLTVGTKLIDPNQPVVCSFFTGEGI